MQMHVTVEVKDNLVGDIMPKVIEASGKVIPSILNSGKVVCSGLFADKRGGFFVVDIEDAEEINRLFGQGLDIWNIESRPVVPFEKISERYEQLRASGV